MTVTAFLVWVKAFSPGARLDPWVLCSVVLGHDTLLPQYHHFWSIGGRSVSVSFAQKWLKSSGRSCLTSVDQLEAEASRPSVG